MKQTGWQQTALLYSFLNRELISCSIQGSDCSFLTDIQVSREMGKMVWYSPLYKTFPQLIMIHIVKGFLIVDETEIGVCVFFFFFFPLEFPSFLYDPVNVGNLISGSFSKLSLDI